MAANSPLGVMYIEVNDVNFLNTGCYTLENRKQPLFDIGIIFAANINYDIENSRAILYFNESVNVVLSDVEKYVRPLQAQGIKVLLSILGNHEGAGVCNFPNAEAARDFANQLNDAVNEYGLDGIDFDDEYADYGNNGTGQPNPDSFLFLLRELRELMPEKIISFYFYGPATSRLENGDLIAGDYLDYSWNAIYGTYSPPNVPGLTKEQLGPAAINVNSTSAQTAINLANRTIEDEYGVYLYYSLPGENVNGYLSGISQALYGEGVNLAENCLQPWISVGPVGPMRDPPLDASVTRTGCVYSARQVGA